MNENLAPCPQSGHDLSCTYQHLRPGLCPAVSVLGRAAGNKGTTGTAASVNKERIKMRMKSKFSLGRMDTLIPDRNK